MSSWPQFLSWGTVYYSALLNYQKTLECEHWRCKEHLKNGKVLANYAISSTLLLEKYSIYYYVFKDVGHFYEEKHA